MPVDGQLTIKQISALTSLNPHTIRAWERRYNALTPERQSNGRRLYSNLDKKRLTLLAKLVDAGHSISIVAGHSTEVLEFLTESIEAKPSISKVTANIDTSLIEIKTSKKSPFKDVSEFILANCLEALLCYNLITMHSELESARQLLSARDFVFKLTLPLLRKVGELVQENSMSIAQEHGLSAVLRSQLMQILFNARNSIAIRAMTRKDLHEGLNISFATPEGDLHEFGILCAAILAAINGHFPHFFGANMPADALAEATNAIQSQVLVIGVMHTPLEKRVLTDSEYGKRLNAILNKNVQIFWGGNSELDTKYFEEFPTQKSFSSLESLDEHLVRLN